MASADLTRLYIGDYFADTLDFTSKQHSVIRTLLLHLWLKTPTTLKEQALRKQAGLSRADWRQTRDLLMPVLQTALKGVLDWNNAIKVYDGQRLPPHEWHLLRSLVLMRDAYTCAYCGSTEGSHADHRVAVSRGGSNTLSNLVTACGPCNQSKGSKEVRAWLDSRRAEKSDR